MAEYLIVGAGPAGAACAERLRELDPDARIVLAGRELDQPYDRPSCSKGLLRGEVARSDVLLKPEDFWEQQRIELRTRTSVMKLDPAARTAALQGGEELSFDAALLATGAMVRRLRLDGSQLEGIHYLRTPGNSEAIAAEAREGARAVLVGGSFIACEVAASLTMRGVECTLLMQEDSPLSAALGRKAGEWVGRLLERHGVRWHGGREVERFEGAERVERVLTAGGGEFEADFVVMGTGAMPDVMLARSSGLELGDTGGVRCSAALETSAPGIFAAGDSCEYESVLHGAPVRIEHWEVAAAQGRCAAEGMAGRPKPFDEVPYFWTDIGDWATLEAVGAPHGWDEEEVRGSLDGDGFSVMFRAAGRLVGAVTAGRPDDLDEAREALRGSAGQADRLNA